MQIMIDIDKKDYLSIKKYTDNITSYPVTLHLYEAVRKGIPLPKNHGDLIDRQELLKNTLCKTFGLRTVDVENAPTIIEADTESEE